MRASGGVRVWRCPSAWSAATRSRACSRAAGWPSSTSPASPRSTATSRSSGSTARAIDPQLAQRFVARRGSSRARPPERRHGARLLRARRHALHRDGVRARAARCARTSAICDSRRSLGVLEDMLAALAHAPSARDRRTATSSPRTSSSRHAGRSRSPTSGSRKAYDAVTAAHRHGRGARARRPTWRPSRPRGERGRPAHRPLRRGVIAYELLPGGRRSPARHAAGRALPPRERSRARARAGRSRAPRRSSSGSSGLLAKSPDDRPASPAEAWRALEEVAVADSAPTGVVTRRWARATRRRVPAPPARRCRSPGPRRRGSRPARRPHFRAPVSAGALAALPAGPSWWPRRRARRRSSAAIPSNRPPPLTAPRRRSRSATTTPSSSASPRPAAGARPPR